MCGQGYYNQHSNIFLWPLCAHLARPQCGTCFNASQSVHYTGGKVMTCWHSVCQCLVPRYLHSFIESLSNHPRAVHSQMKFQKECVRVKVT
jgi:hypothetical protein